MQLLTQAAWLSENKAQEISPLLRIEISLALPAILIVCIWPALGQECFGWLEGRFSEFSRNRAQGCRRRGVLAVVTLDALLPEQLFEAVVYDE